MIEFTEGREKHYEQDTGEKFASALLTATIWGVAFVAQSVGMDYVGPFTFNMVRSLIGGIVLIPCIFLLGRLNSPEKHMQKENAKTGILNERSFKSR